MFYVIGKDENPTKMPKKYRVYSTKTDNSGKLLFLMYDNLIGWNWNLATEFKPEFSN